MIFSRQQNRPLAGNIHTGIPGGDVDSVHSSKASEAREDSSSVEKSGGKACEAVVEQKYPDPENRMLKESSAGEKSGWNFPGAVRNFDRVPAPVEERLFRTVWKKERGKDIPVMHRTYRLLLPLN